jgi:hypothetical protein
MLNTYQQGLGGDLLLMHELSLHAGVRGGGGAEIRLQVRDDDAR